MKWGHGLRAKEALEIALPSPVDHFREVLLHQTFNQHFYQMMIIQGWRPRLLARLGVLPAAEFEAGAVEGPRWSVEDQSRQRQGLCR